MQFPGVSAVYFYLYMTARIMEGIMIVFMFRLDLHYLFICIYFLF